MKLSFTRKPGLAATKKKDETEMRLTNDWWLRIARLAVICLIAFNCGMAANGQAVSTTTVQGTIYLANGQPGGGTLTVSWPTFTTAAGQLVAADRTTVAIGNDGFVSINLAPNQGATPAGEFYTAILAMSDGTVNTQYWIVPAAAQATLAQVQSQVMPAAQAVQAVSKAYVDEAIEEATQSVLSPSGGSLTGPLYLSGDPTQALQAADKHYVDTQVATAVPLAGGNMTGALSTPAVNGVEAPAANSQQTTLQAAMNAAGANGAMEIPPGYAGADTFTNSNGVRVTDLRTSGAQQAERSVKEFGAVCDGVTDDTNALQTAINYAQAHSVALTIPQGTCKARTLSWHGESIGGLGKQVSALMGFPGEDVLATTADSPNILSYTRLHDLTIYVDQSLDVSCSPATGRAATGSCQFNRPMESNTVFSRGGNGLNGTLGSGAAWSIGNCGLAMPATTGAGGNGLKNAQIENLEIVATGTDPMTAQYAGAHSTHTCGLYLAQWPQWSEFKNIDIRGLNTGIAIPALPITAPAGLLADSNRWQNITIQATHGFTAAAGCNGILDDVTAMAGNSAATGEAPTGIVLDLPGGQEGWTVRNAVVTPNWNAVQPALTVTSASGAVTAVTVGSEHGLGWDPYGATVPVAFSGSCTAQANAAVNSDGSIGAISVTQGGVGCSATTTASINAPGNWDTEAPVNLIGGQNMTFFAGSLLRGHGGYTVWNATGAQSYGTQVNGGGGNLPGGGSYPAFVANSSVGSTLQVDQFPGANFGARLQACVSAVNASFGGICDARNFTGSQTMSANLTISTPNITILLPCATITTANQVIVTAGTRNVALRGCAMRGGTTASGSQGGTAIAFSGTGAAIQVGDPAYAVDTPGFHMDNSVINTTGSTSATAQGLVAYRTQELDLEDMYFLGNSNQTGMTLDGTGNYTGGTIRSVQIGGFQTGVNAIGHQAANPATTDWMNASTFVRLHIDCPTSSGSPIAGTVGINLQQGDGNTFTGGDVEGCATALHLGGNAQNNTIIGLRNENSTSQVVADAGSAYNNWVTGGTMFTGKLTDNGTRNSFQDTFHRSFNGMNGDWYGSQQDATVTNHFRLGTGTGNERGLLNEYQTDYGYRWTEGLSDATAGEQFYQILDQLNNVYRISIGQFNNGQSSTNNQTAMNSAGTGAVVLNGTANAGTGGTIFGSGGASPNTVATIDNAGDAQFNGKLQVGGTAQSTGTMTVRNNADAEVDYYLWPGLTASQKGSFTYKDWNGNSQWYMEKDASNNWALNSAIGGLDSFKAYQSSNSGDTYIDASNASGHIRLNYEQGSGAETDIYSGTSANLVASFLGPTSVKFPGLAASSGLNCLQIDNSGYITNTGAACGSGTINGNVSSGVSGQIAYYTANGTTIGGMSSVPVTSGGTGATSASTALANLGGLAANGCATSTGGNLNCAGSLVAATMQSSQSPEFYVTAYGAVGNCSLSGSTSSCTDNTSAFNAAVAAAFPVSGTVVLPPNPAIASGPTVYYVANPINWKGVSFRGPAGAAGAIGGNPSVAVRGAAGKDVFAIGDPATLGASYVQPLQRFAFRDFAIVVDDSVDASSSGANSFPNRLPGRTFFDAATTLVSANGITAPAYSSGGSPSGSGTCLYADAGGFGGTGAQITLTISSGTVNAITVYSSGFGYTNVPTNWTYVSPTGATCSGNVATTGGTTAGTTYKLTSTGKTAYFQPGDVGQMAAVWGAGSATCPGGTAAGTSCLITPIIGYIDAKDVYLSTGSTTVSAAHAYVSTMGMPATQTIGNAAIAYDATSYNGTEGQIGSGNADFENLNITTTDGTGQHNNAAGFFFQGAGAPYGDRWEHDSIRAQWGFAFVPSNAVAPGPMCAGICDFNVFDHTWINSNYPFLAYGGNDNRLQDVQISVAVQGPNILNADAPAALPFQWHIDIPELENPSHTCAAGWMAYRIAGENHVVSRLGTPYCSSGSEGFQWDALNSTAANVSFDSLSPINITGSENSFTSPLALNTGGVWNVTGGGNVWITCASENPLDSIQPGRCQYAGLSPSGAGAAQVSRGAIALNRTHDFIDHGAGNYYLNSEDLWMWPAEVGGWGGITPSVVQDSTAQTGTALSIPSGTQASYYLYEVNNTSLSLGAQIPAGPMRVYFRARTTSGTATFNFDATYSASGEPGSSLGCNLAMSLTTAYQQGSCDVNASGLSGDRFGIRLGNNSTTSTGIYIDWIGVRPWNADETDTSLAIGQGTTPMTSVAGNGGYAQETTSATKKSNDLASFDANGNVVDSSISNSNVALLSGAPSFSGSVTGGGSAGASIGGSGLVFPTAGTSSAPSAPQLGTWTSLGEGYFPVSAYGALGTASDDGPAIQAAINAAEAWGANCTNGGNGVVVFNNITYPVKSALNWDPSVSSLAGNGAILNMTGSTVSGPMVTVAQSNPVCQSIGVNAGVQTVKNTMQGLYFRGPGNTTNTNLFFFQSTETVSTGNQSDTYNSQVEIDNVSALQFNVVETFGNNAYLVRHKNVHWSQCNICISWPTGVTNSGENVSYIDGIIDQSNQAMNVVSSAELYFKGTSFDFDNCGVYNYGGHLVFENTHWEWNTSGTCADYFEQDNYPGGSLSFVHSSVQMDGSTGTSGDIFDARSNGLINIDDTFFNNMAQSTSQQLVSVNPGDVRVRNSRTSSSSHIYNVRSYAFGSPSVVGAVAVFPDGSFESDSPAANQLWIGADTATITSRTAGTNLSVAISNGTGACGTAKYGTYSLAITKAGAAGTTAAVWIAGPMPPEQMVAGLSGWYNKLGSETGTLVVTKYWMNLQGNNQYGIPIIGTTTELGTAAAQDSVTFTSSSIPWTQFQYLSASSQNFAPQWANSVGIYYDLTQMNAGTVCIDGVNLDPM